MPVADLSNTRRVSLGHKDKADLQVVTLERQGSFSSTSTDYEEIDLSDRTPPDSEANGSGSDIDDAESDKKIEVDSPRDDQEMESKEDSDEGRDVGDEYDDETNEVATDEENNSVWSDNEDFRDNVVLTDEGGIENNISTDEDDLENNLDLSDKDSGEDIQESSQNYLEALEALEDELNDSANEINVLNDISITIANESLVSHSPTNLDEHLEVVDDEVEDNTGLNQENESDNESINEFQMTSTQRIVVSQSDSEEESYDKVETEMTKENQCTIIENEMIVDQPVVDNPNVKEKKESVATSAISSSEKVNTKVLALKSKPKNILKTGNEKPTDLIAKPSLKVVKSASSKLPSAEKTDLVALSNLKKDKTQELLPNENTMDKAKETKEPRNVKGTAQKGSEKVSSKAVDCERKADISGNKESKLLSTELKLQTESEEKMDFDQLSIEDEDSDFEEEEEENQPAVKSKIGLNKMPIERKRRKRSYSSENDRIKRHSRSPERSRASSRSYRDRPRGKRLHDRSREGFSKRRSMSPSTDRRHRGSDSRYRRSRSRDRKQNRISSRESRRYRSRSRSNSRTRSNTTEKVVKTNVDKPIKKENLRGNVKERLELKKNLNTRPLSTSPRKEIKTQDSGIEEKTVRTKHAKSLSNKTKIANGTKVVLKPKIQRDVDGVIIKQPKGLCPIKMDIVVDRYTDKVNTKLILTTPEGCTGEY